MRIEDKFKITSHEINITSLNLFFISLFLCGYIKKKRRKKLHLYSMNLHVFCKHPHNIQNLSL